MEVPRAMDLGADGGSPIVESHVFEYTVLSLLSARCDPNTTKTKEINPNVCLPAEPWCLEYSL